MSTKDYNNAYDDYIRKYGGHNWSRYIGARGRTRLKKENSGLYEDARSWALKKSNNPLTADLSEEQQAAADNREWGAEEASQALNDMYGTGDGSGMHMSWYTGDSEEDGGSSGRQQDANRKEQQPETNTGEGQNEDDDSAGSDADSSDEPEPGAYDEPGEGYDLAKDPAARKNYSDKNDLMDQHEMAEEKAAEGAAKAGAGEAGSGAAAAEAAGGLAEGAAAAEAAAGGAAAVEGVAAAGALAEGWPILLVIIVIIIVVILLTGVLQSLSNYFGNLTPESLDKDAGSTICLDAGHPPNGAGGEPEINLKVATEVEAELKSRGYKVIMTRTNSSAVSLEARPKKCLDANADFMYSFHADGTSRSAGYPYQIYMKSNRTMSITSKKYADIIQDEVARQVNGVGGLKNGGICAEGSCTAVDSLAIFSGADKGQLPAVLTEMVQLKNNQSKLDDNSVRRKLVVGIANGIQAAVPLKSSSSDETPSNTGEAIVKAAKKYLGTKYVWAGGGYNGPTLGGFDCSGLAMYAVYQGTNKQVKLPHSSRAQIHYGKRISKKSDLKVGDLVFFGVPTIHHVGIYVGNGKMINAPYTGAKVRIEPLHSEFVGGARIE